MHSKIDKRIYYTLKITKEAEGLAVSVVARNVYGGVRVGYMDLTERAPFVLGIDDVTVHYHYQGQGIGKELYLAAFELIWQQFPNMAIRSDAGRNNNSNGVWESIRKMRNRKWTIAQWHRWNGEEHEKIFEIRRRAS